MTPATSPAISKELPDFSLVLGGPLYQLWRRTRLAGGALDAGKFVADPRRWCSSKAAPGPTARWRITSGPTPARAKRRMPTSSFLQPFVACITKTYTTVTVNTESTYDWDNEQWTVPLNLQVSHLLKIGDQPISVGVGGRYYAEKPAGGPGWRLRFIVQFLFPK